MSMVSFRRFREVCHGPLADPPATGRHTLSSRYARASKPPKRPKLKLSTFQLVAAIGALLLICGLIGGFVGTLLFDSDDGSDSSGDNAVVNSSELLEELRRSAEANPDSSMAQAAYANYLANTGDITTAIPFYERAIELEPDNWTFRLDFSQSLSNSGYLADAEYQLDTILDQDRENAEAWFYLAELYLQFDPPRDDEAIFAYQQVIRYDPTSFLAEQASARLTELGVATPQASPVAQPEATP